MDTNSILRLEMKRCFDFFWNEVNNDKNSKGYGLMLDRSDDSNIASIASVGFALSAYVIGVIRGFVSYEEGRIRTLGTLNTLRYNIVHYKGFFPHFLNMNNCERANNSEFSTIDTGLLLNGIIVCDSFFKDKEINRLSNEIFNRIQWQDFIFEENGKKLLHMAYNDISYGAYANMKSGFICSWNMSAEQQMLYLFAASSDKIDEDTAKKLYLGFDRPYKKYGDIGCVYEPGGTLFTYHYSHAFFNFKDYATIDDIDWWKNSKNAILAQINWCHNNENIKTFAEGLWGVSASDSPNGYSVEGCEPCIKPSSNGTISPAAILGSLPFLYDESAKAIEYLFNIHPELFGRYGFKDAYNADNNWHSKIYIGIDKGISMVSINNYLHGDIYKNYMSHRIIQKAIEKLSFRNITESEQYA